MINLTQLTIDAVVAELRKAYQQAFGDREPQRCHDLVLCGRQALEAIASTDTLYHDVEHTSMVALAGQAILNGKQLRDGDVAPRDWQQITLALLYHDIGYVRGICLADRGDVVATGVNGETVAWPKGKSAAALAPYHVDRGKLFVRERFGIGADLDVDVEKITEYIERTRFPAPALADHKNSEDFSGLVRAADYIGQLADPGYLRKIPALFHEYAESNATAELGHCNPDSMRKNYGQFFMSSVYPHIQEALGYLEVTQEGRQWTANLYAHVFSAGDISQSAGAVNN